ncbi:hypothetical protein B9C88_01460 [Brevibacillus laterosporus]|uniref:hypothetical protein n=1 Tax=Brevibacillus laterosporus TaxID=1465 RepID=UPI0002404559|nr:hypothetical protein B9C88_01460 [Brevibacillus laterosporus]CCF12668.1 methionine aminopeptidase domain protein [Brevibacillus laterosporus GI-9]
MKATDKPLKNGDIVTIDFVANLHGGLADSLGIQSGTISEEARHLLQVTKGLWLMLAHGM